MKTLFEIINALTSHPNISFWIAASVPDVVFVNPNGTKMCD